MTLHFTGHRIVSMDLVGGFRVWKAKWYKIQEIKTTSRFIRTNQSIIYFNTFRRGTKELRTLRLLTARPWAERGSCSTLGLFFLIFFLSETRRRCPLGQL